MIKITKFLFLNSIKDKVLITFIAFACLIAFVAMSYGNLVIIEKPLAVNSFVATALRISTLLSITLYICFSIKQLRDGKMLEIFIANGLSRIKLVTAALLNFMAISFIFCLLSLLFFDITINSLLWSLSLFCEALILSSIALAVIMTFNSPVASFLSVLAFYIFSRVVGFILFMLKSPQSTEPKEQYLSVSYEILSYIVPRLDLFTKSEWINYGFNNNELLVVLVQTAIYVPLILLISIKDFSKKEL